MSELDRADKAAKRSADALAEALTTETEPKREEAARGNSSTKLSRQTFDMPIDMLCGDCRTYIGTYLLLGADEEYDSVKDAARKHMVNVHGDKDPRGRKAKEVTAA